MNSRKEHNNPKKLFREQDDLVVSPRDIAEVVENKISSVRESHLTSIVPDETNWNNIYVGKQHGIHSIKPEADSRGNSGG